MIPHKEKERDSWINEKLEAFFLNHQDDGEVIRILAKNFRDELGIPAPEFGYAMRLIFERLPGIQAKGRATIANPTIYLIPNRVKIIDNS